MLLLTNSSDYNFYCDACHNRQLFFPRERPIVSLCHCDTTERGRYKIRNFTIFFISTRGSRLLCHCDSRGPPMFFMYNGGVLGASQLTQCHNRILAGSVNLGLNLRPNKTTEIEEGLDYLQSHFSDFNSNF